MSSGPRGDRILVGGVGNVFFSDDGFGSEVARRLLAAGDLPEGVDVVDVGIRGMHLAYQVLEGYRSLVVVDTTHGDGPPGSLYLLEHDLAAAGGIPGVDGPAFDPHGMEPDAVLELIGALARGVGEGRGVERVLVLGCEPADLGAGMDLSPPVAGAVDEAVAAVRRVVARLIEDRPFEVRTPDIGTTEEREYSHAQVDPDGTGDGGRGLGGAGVAPGLQEVPAPAEHVAARPG